MLFPLAVVWLMCLVHVRSKSTSTSIVSDPYVFKTPACIPLGMHRSLVWDFDRVVDRMVDNKFYRSGPGSYPDIGIW